jgi:TonB family protein
MLELGKEAFPSMVQSKAPAVERHRTLYEAWQQAKHQFQQEKWEEAETSLTRFLNTDGPFDFTVFESLKKEAEEMLATTREKLRAAQKPTPATISKEAAAMMAPPVAVKKSSVPRIAIYLVLGIIAAAGAWWVTNSMKKEAETPDVHPNLIVRKLTPPPQPGQPKPTAGVISITSEPPGATVLLGTEEKGKTPLKLSDVAFGKHQLTLKLQGYQDLVQEIELSENRSALEMPAVLQTAVPQVGILIIESNPPGAFIAMGTRVVGQTPTKLDKAKVGKYNIVLRKEGYIDHTESVRVKDGETTTLKAELKEVPKVVVEAPKPVEPEVKPGMLVTLGPGVTPPRTLKKSAVEYPDTARKQKLEGTVQLNLLISETGQVLDVRILKSAHQILDDAAVRTVKQWTYEPAKKQNVPVRVWLSTSITFVKR